MIEFKQVTLHYHYDEFTLLKGSSFTLHDGVNTLLADTQSGKSSICKLLCKEVKPTDGEILVDGMAISSITSAGLGILYLPSVPTFFKGRSARYNVEYPLKVRKTPKNERKRRVDEVAQLLGVDCLDVKVSKLTDEQKKLVALARGLTVKRKVVLFDDFFAVGDAVDSALNDVKSVIGLFPDAICVVLTSDKRLAMGHCVVLDGGVTVYEGDEQGATQIIDGLEWISSRSE